MRERLEELNPWWTATYKLETIKRTKYLSTLLDSLKKKEITIITGIRRVGKTTLIKQIINHLLEQKINPKHILFVSLDLLYLKDYTIQDIVLEYKKIQEIPLGTKTYLFLDEITYKPDFNQELKNLYDLENYKIYASSSSAKILKDKKAFLTGRAKYIEIAPLNFEEFLQFTKQSTQETHLLKKRFEQYMQIGGMPEYVLTRDPTYLSELLELVISKDVISKHEIKYKQIIYDLFRLLCERIGKQISYNKIAKILGVDNETVSRYIGYFEDTYLFNIVEIEGKLNEKIRGKKKLYCIDVGLKNSITGFRDKGAIFENLVYNKIKNKNPRFLQIDGIEIDFVFEDTIIEAKYGQELEGKQKELFEKIKYKNKIIARDMNFFI